MNIHLISIGGAVMHNLALELFRNGHRVTGSDDEVFEPSRSRLDSAGILPDKMGWDANRIDTSIDLIILGMHARKDNPELIRAQELKIPIQSFPEYVAAQSEKKTRVVIAGSHGKTTTTAMVMHILGKANRPFDYLVGSKLDGFDLMVKLSDAPVIIIEGDEYLSSPIDPQPKFLWYHPHVAVITGIAWDHINVFPTYEMYCEQFRLFANSMEDGGTLYYYEDDPDLKRQLKDNNDVECIPYSIPETGNSNHVVRFKDEEYEMKVFGNHNLANMQAAVNLCSKLGIDEQSAWKSLESFGGTARRLEEIFKSHEKIAYRDFAHSPSKVGATVEAVAGAFPGKKLFAVLELHTFSSLSRNFIEHYKNTMDPATKAVVFFDPHVFEMKRMEPLTREEVEKAFGNVEVVVSKEELLSVFKKNLYASTFLFMSSGNFGGIKWDDVLKESFNE